MNKLDRTGTFKAIGNETGVSVSTNGFPQWVCLAQISDMWVEEDDSWLDVSEQGWEIPVYMCLVGYKKGTKELATTLNHTQVMAALGWDGTSFDGLDELDVSTTKFQIRVEDNDPDYADKNPFQVSWIDAEDAVPGRKMKRLDKEGLKDLDSTFASLLKAGKPVTAKSAKSSKKGSKTKPKVTKTNKAKKDETKSEDVTNSAPPERTAPPETPKKAAPPPGDEGETELPSGHCTKNEAWQAVVTLKRDDVTDPELSELWLGNLEEVTGQDEPDQAAVTDEQWFLVKEATLSDVAKF